MVDLSFNKEEFDQAVTEEQKIFLNFCINLKVAKEILIFIINEFIPKFSPTNLDINNSNLFQLVLYYKNGSVTNEDFLNNELTR